MIRFAIYFSTVVSLTLFWPMCRAKIVDCPAIVSGDTEYSSHSNYVQAVKVPNGKVLWRTTLFTETYAREFDPKLEEDVQWNIACIREVQTAEVIASDKRNRIFRVNKVNGKLTSTSEASK